MNSQHATFGKSILYSGLFFLLTIGNFACAQNKTAEQPQLLVQYSNRTAISKIAFSEDGRRLAIADRSGFIVLRDLATQLNFAGIQLQSQEINFIKFEENKLFVCGDFGLEIINIASKSATIEKAIASPYLYHYVLVNSDYYFVGQNGKLQSIAKDELRHRPQPNFKQHYDGKKQIYYLIPNGSQLLMLGRNELEKFDLNGKKLISTQKINYNLGMYHTVSSAKGDLIMPAYEKMPMAFTNLDEKPQYTIPSSYKLEKVKVPKHKVGEMGIKMAFAINNQNGTIYVAEEWSAAAINEQGILALGDYNGDVVLYDPLRHRILSNIPSSTNVNQLIAVSHRSNLLAVAAGNTKTSAVKIISLKDGKTLYESEEVNFDVAKMEFTKDDSALIIFYPNRTIHKIDVKGKVFVKSTLNGGIITAESRAVGLINFEIGAGALSANLAEQDFIKKTSASTSFHFSDSTKFKVTLIRSESLPPNKMPSAQKVNDLLRQFELDKEPALQDQMDKDLFVMKAINYEEARFDAAIRTAQVNAIKAKKLYQSLRQSNGESIAIKSPSDDFQIDLPERARGLWIHQDRSTVYVIGAQTLYSYRFANGQLSQSSLKFRKQGEVINYRFDLPNDRLFLLNGNKIEVIDLKLLRSQFSLYSFTGSTLYQTPSNYYFSSNKIPQMAFEYQGDLLQFDQFDLRYNRPDKVLQVMGSTDTALISAYYKAYEKRIRRLGVDTTLFQNSYSIPKADFKNRTTILPDQKIPLLSLHIVAQDDETVLTSFNVWVNETPLFGAKGINLKNRGIKTLDTIVSIILSDGDNSIETAVTNSNGIESLRRVLLVNYEPANTKPSKVYFIGIGANTYANKDFNLNWSVKDIKDLAEQLKMRFAQQLIVDTLYNENVTVANIKALKQKLLQTDVDDKVIIAYSGHGILAKNYDYYLSTYQINFDSPNENGLPYEDLETLLDGLSARKKLLLIDACHSGEIDKGDQQPAILLDSLNKNFVTKGGVVIGKSKATVGLRNSFQLMQELFANLRRGTGATIISAAAGHQYALEKHALKNGVFTYAVLEYLKSQRESWISALKSHVYTRVMALTAGLQVPTARTETNLFDWSIY